MASNATSLTRRQAAAVLGISETELKAGDHDTFHPLKGPDGSWRYPAEEIAAVLRGVAGGDPAAEPSGAICASAFELFLAGKKLPEVVIGLKQPPAVVRGLRSEYDAMAASLTLNPTMVETLAKLLRTPLQDESQVIAAVTALAERAAEEFERGYAAGIEETNDMGEIVDPITGEKRPVRAGDLVAHQPGPRPDRG